MTKTVVGLFDTVEGAQKAVTDIAATGIARDQINLMAQDASQSGGSGVHFAEDRERLEKGEAVTTDAIAGAMFGGFGGALIGVLALAIPGLGPLVAAGPIAAALAGMTAGAAGGAAIGALQTAGITGEDAHVYAEAVKRGGTLVAVHAEEAEIDRVRKMLDDHGAVDVDARAEEFRQSGWTEFDEKAAHPPVGAVRETAPTESAQVGTVREMDSVAPTSYVGQTNSSTSQVPASNQPHRIDPTDTTLMTSTENVPHAGRLRSKVYDHIKT